MSGNDDYLWNRSGTADPEIVRLEKLLGELRHGGALRDLPPRTAQRQRSRRIRGIYAFGALAAGLIVAAAVAITWIVAVQPRLGWQVQAMAGAPSVDGQPVEDSARLGVGRWLVTDAVSRARIAVGQIGEVQVEPNSRIQLLESRTPEHRLSLDLGTIHARIWAPPKLFFVNTPAAVAVDLGCAYTLQVNPDGSGLLHVTLGWVAFEHVGRDSFIPQGAVCATRPGIGPGTPYYEDAAPAYSDALTVLDFGNPGDPRRAASLDAVLAQARRRDVLTLWHLLRRGTPDERARVFDRMAALAPPPPGVTRDAVLAGDRRAIDSWWSALGLDGLSWWKVWQKKW